MKYNKIDVTILILRIIVCLFMVILILGNIKFKDPYNQEYQNIFWVYFTIISIILNSVIFLMQRLYKSFKELNPEDEIPIFKNKITCNSLLIVIPVIIVFFIISINLSIVIHNYIFDSKIKFNIHIKHLSFVFLCITVVLSFYLLILLIAYMYFIDKVLSKSTENLICFYPISIKIFRDIRNIFTNINFTYWTIISLYMILIFFHTAVYSGYFINHNIDLIANIGQNFSYIWVIFLVVILIGYFIIFYFPNKILYNYVLKIKLQTISKISNRINIYNNSDFEIALKKIEFTYNSPAAFKNFFLSKVITVLSTAVTMAISILQLLQ